MIRSALGEACAAGMGCTQLKGGLACCILLDHVYLLHLMWHVQQLEVMMVVHDLKQW